MWKKLGHVYSPNGHKPWALSHGANPVAEHIDGDLYRIYFSCRDKNNYSSIGYVEININNPTQVIRVADEPVLTPGEIGSFDDCGASIGCIVKNGNKRFLYYMGWNLTQRSPWRNALGVAVSVGDEPFQRVSRGPVINLDGIDPFTISYPWVMIEPDGKWKMWYGSNIKWGREKREMAHLIKYAESDDGLNWEKHDIVAIDFKDAEEYAICKPCVIKDNGLYKMWFACRGKAYRVGYSESTNGIVWTRMDDIVGIDVSESGWDAETIEYPFVFDHKENRYMLYSGNAFGRSGFGIAILET